MAMMACVAGFIAIWFAFDGGISHREIIGAVGGLLFGIGLTRGLVGSRPPRTTMLFRSVIDKSERTS